MLGKERLGPPEKSEPPSQRRPGLTHMVKVTMDFDQREENSRLKDRLSKGTKSRGAQCVWGTENALPRRLEQKVKCDGSPWRRMEINGYIVTR